jgi:ubiquinone/menaquinone biosynthesis C-methylase UbiE
MNTSYFMEDAREAKRLAAKVDPAAWVSQFLAPEFPPEGKILDVGCGPGVIAAEVARRSSTVQVCGVDLSDRRITDARSRLNGLVNLEFHIANADTLPFSDETFDLVYSRFIMDYLRDKQAAVHEMIRVCKPGGRILLQDLDGQLLWHYPEDDHLQEQIRTVLDALAHRAATSHPPAARTMRAPTFETCVPTPAGRSVPANDPP